MKKIKLLLLFVTLFGFASINAYAQTEGNSASVLELMLFGSSTCGECKEIEHTLVGLEKKHAGKLKVKYHHFEDTTSFKLMIHMEELYGVTDPSPQELFFPDTVFLGYKSIMSDGLELLESYMADSVLIRRGEIVMTEPAGSFKDAIKKRLDLKPFTFWGVAAAALVDAINPCAIATMIFLISFLTTQKRRRSEILQVGLTFSAAVFATYFLLGLGAFRLITALDQYFWVSRVIKWSAVAFAGGIGIISFVDALRYKKTGSTKEITLQLPKSVKLRIHKVISENLTGKRLIIGTLITGFLVTLLEAVCTGQVYLPTIVLMTRMSESGEMQLMGWFYLILYNFIFVLPLLAVMIAAYYGMKWNTLAKMTQKNLTLLKILLGFVMIGLAAFLAFA
ncbi:MAG: hypothetical protein LBB56_03590 [Chitinispirillales bacterium]|nr:hypothetical protein [Chitinispirillales bacterium]